jgi:hypothetical protein
LTLPVQELMPQQASAALAFGGGHARTRVENFSHHGIFSFKSAYSEVSGRSSSKKSAHNTLAQTVIEGLNIHEIVTCDRIVSRIACHKPKDGGEFLIIPFGCTFDNLRIGGYKMEPDLAIDWFTEHDTYDKFVAFIPKIKAQFKKMRLRASEEEDMPKRQDLIACTMVRDFGTLPPGVEKHGHGLWVPEFGMVFLAEMFMTQSWRRVRMIRTVLGCGSEGCYGGGNTGGGGVPYP